MGMTRKPHLLFHPRHVLSFRHRTVAALLMATSIVLLLVGGSMLTFLLTRPPDHNKPVLSRQIMAPVAGPEAHTITMLGQHYMHALVQGDSQKVWSMLSPQEQAHWHHAAAFGTYLKARFADYHLQGFTLGQVTIRPFWVNPETMERFDQVYQLPTSLLMNVQLPPDQLRQLAPPFQQPDQLFQQIPLLLQRIPGVPAHGVRWRLLNAGPADIEAPMLPPIHPMRRIVKVPILMYHHVSDIPPQNVLDRSLTVSETLFRHQLDVLTAKGFQSITLNQLMAALYYQVALPPKPVILTFDDGYDDAYFSAYPLLKAHGFSGMFYIITGKVGWRGQATWSQLRDMLDHGMQMGSHTIHHVDMGSTYVTSKLQAEQEAHISQHMLQQNLHTIIQHFCYPNGGPFKGSNRSLQQAVVALLASTGYIDATTDPGPTGIIQSSQAPFALLRLRIDGRFSLPFFENTIQTDTT